MRTGLDDVVLRALKLTATNACLSEGFSRAGCKVETYKSETIVGRIQIYAVGSIFTRGVRVLRNFLDKDSRIPKDEKIQEALFKLLKFIEGTLYRQPNFNFSTLSK